MKHNTIDKLMHVRSVSDAKSGSPMLLSRSKIGVEFEVVGWNDQSSPNGWSSTRDGSIRGRGGREFVFGSPMGGTVAAQALDNFFQKAAKCGWEGNASTAQHVHVNVTNMTDQQLLIMLSMYAILERSIYRWVGDDRINNNNCRPWFMSSLSLIGLTHSFHRRAPIAYTKYCGLNLSSLPTFGTVEFRHKQTELDSSERSVEYINIALLLKEIGMQYSSVEQFVKEVPVDGVHHWLQEKVNQFKSYLPTFATEVSSNYDMEQQADFKAMYIDLVDYTSPPEPKAASPTGRSTLNIIGRIDRFNLNDASRHQLLENPSLAIRSLLDERNIPHENRTRRALTYVYYRLTNTPFARDVARRLDASHVAILDQYIQSVEGVPF